tara:strand:+ start:6500 stop:7624 length:1125 start_codon:yes stop_codon:yes gene_type:complete
MSDQTQPENTLQGVFGNFLGKSTPEAETPEDSSLTSEQPTETPAVETTEEVPEAVTDDNSTENIPDAQAETENISETVVEPEAVIEPEVAVEETSQAPTVDLKEWMKTNEDNLWLFTADLSEIDTTNHTTVMELFRDSLMDNESLSEVDAALYLEDKYPDVFSEYADKDSREYKLQMIEVRKEAKKYLSQLKEVQAGLELPNVTATPSEDTLSQAVDLEVQKRIEAGQQAQAKQQEQTAASLETLADKITKSHDKLSFEIDENSTIEFEPNEEDKKGFKEFLKGYQTYFDKTYVSDGKAQEEQLFKMYIKESRIQDLLKLAKGIGDSKGKEDLIENDVENLSKHVKQTDTSISSITGNSKSDNLARSLLSGKLK